MAPRPIPRRLAWPGQIHIGRGFTYRSRVLRAGSVASWHQHAERGVVRDYGARSAGHHVERRTRPAPRAKALHVPDAAMLLMRSTSPSAAMPCSHVLMAPQNSASPADMRWMITV